MTISADLKASHAQELFPFFSVPGQDLEHQIGPLSGYAVPETDLKRTGPEIVRRHRADVAELRAAVVVLDVLRQSRRRSMAASI